MNPVLAIAELTEPDARLLTATAVAMLAHEMLRNPIVLHRVRRVLTLEPQTPEERALLEMLEGLMVEIETDLASRGA